MRILGLAGGNMNINPLTTALRRCGLTNPGEGREAVQLDAFSQQFGSGRNGFDRLHAPSRANHVPEEHGVISHVGTDIDDRHARLQDRREEQGEPHLPEPVEHQVTGEAKITGGEEHLVAAKHARENDALLDRDRLNAGTNTGLRLSAPEPRQFALLQEFAHPIAPLSFLRQQTPPVARRALTRVPLTTSKTYPRCLDKEPRRPGKGTQCRPHVFSPDIRAKR